MPYEWSRLSSHDTPPRTRLRLWPHRSLPRKGFAAMILATFAMITIPLYPLLGTILLWGLLPFLMLAVAGLWWGLEKSYRDADILEELTIDSGRMHLVRTNPKGDVQDWSCNPYWARIEMHPTGGPVEHYLTLKGDDPREVEIGSFLSVDERKALYGEISIALNEARAG